MATSDRTAVAWNAGAYDIVAGVQERWGRALIERIPWRDHAVVLDAGCGSGRLIPFLVEKIPHGRLYAVDANASMIEQASKRVAELKPAVPVRILQCDLTEISVARLGATVDLVFSNAVFHWITNKLKLFAALRSVMNQGAELHAEFGGNKNLQRTRAAAYRAARNLGLSEAFNRASAHYVFVSPPETKEQLKTCGFRQVRVWEHEQPTHFDDRESFLRFVAAVIFAALRTELNEDQWRRFLDEFAAQSYAFFGEWLLDYVRQNISASA